MLGELREIGDRLRSLDTEHKKLAARRDVLLRRAIDEGLSVTHLARISGLTQGRVSQMKKKWAAEDPPPGT